jgi:hypothetical protein
MATTKPESEPLPAEERPRPGPLPTQGDEVREVGKRALDDAEGPKKDTDEAGYERQRGKAPPDAPTKRSGIADGSKS